ncbi:uncharacterized protein LOC125949113 [Anopheles darlingi]|uniref:uncharacterized protein LOC125949113 n=1 Tax=Anopheles darlingi TaxID=43151 RepID=UPI002100514C|nr:uncharacterized protein LOC125949113 [Anopheles darlingi]
MSHNSNDDNFWAMNQQQPPQLQPPPPHLYPAAHAQQHPAVTLLPVSHALPPHLQQPPHHLPHHPHQHHHPQLLPQLPVPTGPAAGFYNSGGVPNSGRPSLGDAGFAGANGNVFPHGHPPVEDEYTMTDSYGQLIKVVYQTQPPQGGLVRPQEDNVRDYNPPAATKQQYELFSNSSNLISAAPGFGFLFHHQQQQQPESSQQQQQQPTPLPQPSQLHQFTSIAQQSVTATQASSTLQDKENGNSNNTSSMLINQLVGNLAPTISGQYLPFGGNTSAVGPSTLLSEPLQRQQTPAASPMSVDPLDGNANPSPTKTTSGAKPIVNPVPPTISATANNGVAVSSSSSSSSTSSPSSNATNRSTSTIATTSTAAVYNQQNDDNSAKLDQNVNKKQRIVAEVKPMRMSYSDVLSKKPNAAGGATGATAGFTVGTGNNSVSAALSANATVNSGVGGATAAGAGGGSNGNKTSASNGSGPNSMSSKNVSKGEKRGEGKKANGNVAAERKLPSAGANNRSSDGTMKRNNGGPNPTGISAGGFPSVVEANGTGLSVKSVHDKMRKMDSKANSKREKGSRNGTASTEMSDGANKKGRSRRTEDTGSDVGDAGGVESAGSESANGVNDENIGLHEETEEDFDEDDSEEYDQESVSEQSEQQHHQQQQPSKSNAGQSQQQFVYNVKKTVGANDTHIEKIVNSQRGSAASVAHRKGGSRGATSTIYRGPGKQQQPDNRTGGKRSVRSRKNEKYAFAQKLLQKWFEYMVLIVRWLWSLVSDVVYLSIRLAWDYALAGYQYCWQHISTIRQDFRKNSSRPGAWLRGVWQAFDGRFEKESRWAFWRHCWRKKADAETGPTGRAGTHHHKDHGRLPSTADEAMSSLLNCKGKDAYSILGVSPDCSQEQIRKHYKKIAVLVHPDKNKQPGAEEAFKVLQRSFELIGEQETRKEYDQSLAEALNAEKAWSEINDLLTQLHTKISEAANTIRCSSCCLRHPRKPTGRAHFAARECSSCKVRHPAKEGDIWAETSCFGLRWKYLAMMEGNVYDITEWANCQKGALSHLQPNSHVVQYRIVLGSSSSGASSSQQHQQHSAGMQQDKESLGRSRKEPTVNEPNLDDFLNNIYAGQNQQAAGQAASGSRRRYRRN